jgi:dipeptidyl aminopeptidase/acylaminoacyl peptidase
MMGRVRFRGLAVPVALLLLSAGCSAGESSKSQPRHVSRIVFAKGERIWVADRDGHHKRFLVRGEEPEISPDGHWVAFYPCNACSLYFINADGGRARLLARRVEPPVWSPDSRHLATVGVTGGPNFDEQLITLDRTMGTQHRIAIAQRFLGFDFSPDGRQLAFAMSSTPDDLHSDVYITATDGGTLRRLTWDDRSSWPIWAPDGSISFAHREGPLGPFRHDKVWGKHRIWEIFRNGTGRRVLTRRLSKPAVVDERLGLKPVAWSNDGGTLLAVSPTENGEYVYIVGSTGSIRSLGDHGYLGYASAINISRDGRYVLVWVQEDGPDSKRTRVELVPAKGGPARLIARDIGAPSWSR